MGGLPPHVRSLRHSQLGIEEVRSIGGWQDNSASEVSEEEAVPSKLPLSLVCADVPRSVEPVHSFEDQSWMEKGSCAHLVMLLGRDFEIDMQCRDMRYVASSILSFHFHLTLIRN